MLTPTAFATLASPVAPRSTLAQLEARLAVLDALIAARAPAPTLPVRIVVTDAGAVHVTLEPHPLAFGAPMARAVDWEAFGHQVLGTSTMLPNDSRWVKGGAK